MASLNDEHRSGYKPVPGSVTPPVPEHVPMTINGRREGDQPPTLPKADTAAAMAFQAYTAAVAAQREHNAAADKDFEAGLLTEDGWQQRKEAIADTSVPRVVELAEAAVAARQAEAEKKYQDLLGVRSEGDAAAEIRNERYLGQVRRRLDAADSPGTRIAVARAELEAAADRSQRGLLVDEYSAVFAADNRDWIEATLCTVDAEMASAAKECRLSGQVAAFSNYAAKSVRHGFETGSPPTQIGTLAEAVAKYDPDRQ